MTQVTPDPPKVWAHGITSSTHHQARQKPIFNIKMWIKFLGFRKLILKIYLQRSQKTKKCLLYIKANAWKFAYSNNHKTIKLKTQETSERTLRPPLHTCPFVAVILGDSLPELRCFQMKGEFDLRGERGVPPLWNPPPEGIICQRAVFTNTNFTK